MTNVGVVIPVYGDKDKWLPLAETAAESVNGAEVLISIDENLERARNGGAKLFKDKDYIMFLDADDTVHEDFFVKSNEWSGDIIKPDVYLNGKYEPFIQNSDIRRANYLIIGCPVRSELFFRHGGFDEDFPAYTDWHMWARLVVWGRATIEERHDCVYYYNKNSDGVNVSHKWEDINEAKRLLRQI